MKFCAHKSSLVTQMPCSPVFFPLNSTLASVSHTGKNLGRQYSGYFSFMGKHHKTVSAKSTATMSIKTLFIQDCRIVPVKYHAWPHPEYCPIISTHIHKFDRVEIENGQQAFTGNYRVPLSNLTYRTRC